MMRCEAGVRVDLSTGEAPRVAARHAAGETLGARFVRRNLLGSVAVASALAAWGCGEPTIGDDVAEPLAQAAPAPSPASLGALIFADASLSEPAGLACASCHGEQAAFADPRRGPTSPGSVPGRAGPRNAPTIAYASFIPPLRQDGNSFVGGLFLDGRVNSLEAQAAAHFTSPLEMNNPSRAAVMGKIRRTAYAPVVAQVYGAAVLADDRAGFQAITQALAAYERGRDVSRFASKYDGYLAGRLRLTDAEQRGLALFEGKARCASCHPSARDPSSLADAPLFTKFGYHNIGTPKNPDNPFYLQPASLNPQGQSFVDFGLGSTVDLVSHDGKFRVPTLRNVARTAPYGHNGFFPTLHAIVNFYNTRDVAAWPEPEVPATMDRSVGNLRLTGQEVDDIVAFLNTLNDP